MPFGFKEVEGIHSRTNFDLSQHEEVFPVKDPIFRSGVEPELHSVCNRDLDRCRPCVLEHHGGFLLRGDVGEWREPWY